MIHKWLDARGHEWDDFSGLEGNHDEDGDMLFLRTWEELKFPAGEDPLTLAQQKAIEEPVKLLEEHRLTNKYEVFVGLAFHLQRFNDKHATLQHAKAGCIVLPCYKLGFVMGLSHATMSSYRKFAVDHGFLVQEKRHTFSRQRGKIEATEFRFVLERFDPETREELSSASQRNRATRKLRKRSPNRETNQPIPCRRYSTRLREDAELHNRAHNSRTCLALLH